MKTHSNFKYFVISVHIFFIYFIVKPVYADTHDRNSVINLGSLNPQSNEIKELRKDIRKSVLIVKQNKEPEFLPDLRFFTYKVKKNENFWNIMTRSSLDMDTISSINFLVSVKDVSPGKVIYLSNMRGVIYKTVKNETLETISQKTKINKEYIRKVNNIADENNINKEYIFIPSAKISNIERSLLLGVGFSSPLKSVRRTSAFGRRIDPFNNKFDFHTGIDLACPAGSKVYAARNGRIFFTGSDGGYGSLIIIKHENNYTSYYGHLKKIMVKKGEDVKRGDLIAFSGNSGRSTGPHLHFEVRKEFRPVNPVILLK